MWRELSGEMKCLLLSGCRTAFGSAVEQLLTFKCRNKLSNCSPLPVKNSQVSGRPTVMHSTRVSSREKTGHRREHLGATWGDYAEVAELKPHQIRYWLTPPRTVKQFEDVLQRHYSGLTTDGSSTGFAGDA